jgi:hypothetical protein
VSEEPTDGVPERRLLCSVLATSIADYMGEGVHKRSAYRWVRSWKDSDFKRPFTFPWICSELDLCPYTIRDMIKLYVKSATPLPDANTISVSAITAIFMEDSHLSSQYILHTP